MLITIIIIIGLLLVMIPIGVILYYALYFAGVIAYLALLWLNDFIAFVISLPYQDRR
mgnify:CR=1 FL=1